MSLLNVPQSYLYGQYADDANLQATRNAYNEETQSIYNWLATTCIADYRQTVISGSMLDWVGNGVYNMSRFVSVPGTSGSPYGAYATTPYSTVAYAGGVNPNETANAITLTDGQYKNALTWNIYSNDGWVFNTSWLRRRVIRFLFGQNGNDLNVTQYYSDISIQWIDIRTALIVISDNVTLPSGLIAILAQGIQSGYLRTPLGYNIGVIQFNSAAFKTDFGGDIL